MPKLQGTHYVVSAAMTDTGQPVYFTKNGGWSPKLTEARTVEAEADKDAMLESALKQERAVCDPYAFRTLVSNGQIEPTSMRERIRQTGPTSRIRRPDSSLT